MDSTRQINANVINLNKVTVVGYCMQCRQPLLDCLPGWVANGDDFLCHYYGARKLAICSRDSLEKQVDLVLKKLKEAREKTHQKEQNT